MLVWWLFDHYHRLRRTAGHNRQRHVSRTALGPDLGGTGLFVVSTISLPLAMTPEQNARIAEDISYIRTRVDSVHDTVSDFRVHVEGRITRLETKASLLGFIGGLLGSLGIRWGLGR